VTAPLPSPHPLLPIPSRIACKCACGTQIPPNMHTHTYTQSWLQLGGGWGQRGIRSTERAPNIRTLYLPITFVCHFCALWQRFSQYPRQSSGGSSVVVDLVVHSFSRRKRVERASPIQSADSTPLSLRLSIAPLRSFAPVQVCVSPAVRACVCVCVSGGHWVHWYWGIGEWGARALLLAAASQSASLLSSALASPSTFVVCA